MKTWLLLFVLLSGCAGTPSRPPADLASLFDDAAFPAPSGRVDAADLFTLSAPMRAHLHSPEFKKTLRDKGSARGLVAALYSKSDLQLDYDATVTRTAAQTYAERAGNCLSLVVMTAAFARELGMSVRFQSVETEETWSRNGSLYLVSSHVNISLGQKMALNGFSAEADPLVIDFLPPPDAARLRTRALQEADIVALYMNNRAAEELVQGRIADAYWWARAAILQRPALVEAYNTLAVIYARSGQPARAEQVYRAALRKQPDSLVVMQNLEHALNVNGKLAEAQALQRRIDRLYPAPPFHYFNQGMRAYQAGDFRRAKALFAREAARAPDNDEFHFWLGATHLQLGELNTAVEELALARETSTRAETRERYVAKLARLKSSVARPSGR
ncbi:MAG TPA: hypothetical protein DCX52_16555 [Massilia sp.]|nr:hypothetical protein [Massilia sp.]